MVDMKYNTGRWSLTASPEFVCKRPSGYSQHSHTSKEMRGCYTKTLSASNDNGRAPTLCVMMAGIPGRVARGRAEPGSRAVGPTALLSGVPPGLPTAEGRMRLPAARGRAEGGSEQRPKAVGSLLQRVACDCRGANDKLRKWVMYGGELWGAGLKRGASEGGLGKLIGQVKGSIMFPLGLLKERRTGETCNGPI